MSESGQVIALHRTGKLGLRSAYMEGFQKAFDLGAEAVVQMDADFSHDPAVLPEMARRLASCDVVIGSRYIKGGSLDERWPAWRKSAFRIRQFLCPNNSHLPAARYDNWISGCGAVKLYNHAFGSDPIKRLYFSGRNGLCRLRDGIQDHRSPHPFCGPSLGKIKDVFENSA